MKKLLKLATLLFALSAISFVGCEEPTEDWINADGTGIKAEVKSTTDKTITLEVHTAGLSKIAWIAQTTDKTAPAPMLVFRNGETQDVSNGKHTIEVKQLSANTSYNIYFAGEIAATADLTSEVVEVKDVRTADFNEPFTVREVRYDGFTIDVKVPESVKEEDHLIKWATSDFYMYNRNKIGRYGVVPDTELMNLNDSKTGYGQFYFNTSTTIRISEMDSFATDANGNPDYDTYLYDVIVPGQPQMFILGEYEFGEGPWGWGYGYYQPLFNQADWAAAVAKNGGELIDETPYWDGMYKSVLLKAKEPEKLDDNLMDVNIDIRTDDAIVEVTLDESIPMVQIMILSETEHDLVYEWLGRSYEYFQWYATSYAGMMEGATYFYERPKNGVVRTAISEYLLNVSQTSKYWIYVVGLSGYDEEGYMNGSKQVCKNYEFYLKQLTKPHPTIEVTPVEPTEPNMAYFKIFCPSAAEGNPATNGYYISNYEKDWLASGMTAQQLLDNYAWGYEYYQFTTSDLDRINGVDGGDGLVLSFTSRPNENYHFAAMITNDEGARAYSDAVVCRTYETPVDRVESPLFESLKGEWAASATVRYSKIKPETAESENPEYEQFTKTHTCTINVGDVEYPEVLPESVYEAFAKAGVSREETDIYYKEFSDAADLFNENNRDQNRILMNGFNFAGEMLPYLSYFNYMSAFDLFSADSSIYNSLSSSMPIFDFGPKWFIEVMADGTLGVPFNSDMMPPMGSWALNGYGQLEEIHLIGYEPTTPMAIGYLTGEKGAVTGYFPVEISEDGNTITVKPFIYNLNGKELSFYPNVGIVAGYDQSTYAPMYTMNVAILSEITLTRGATAEPARVNAKSVGKPATMEVEPMNEIKRAVRPRKRSVFSESGKIEMVGPDHILTPEQKVEKWMEVRNSLRK